MKKLLIATAVTMFFAVTGFAQDIMTDTINTTVIKNLPLVEPISAQERAVPRVRTRWRQLQAGKDFCCGSAYRLELSLVSTPLIGT